MKKTKRLYLGGKMKYKLIDNELYIVCKIDLNNYEKKILKLTMTFKDVCMQELIETLRIPEPFIVTIIERLNQKLECMKIVSFDNRKKRYRLLLKDELE